MGQQGFQAGLRIRIHQGQEVAPCFNIRPNTILFFFRHHPAWTGYDQDGGIVWDRGFLEERDRTDVITLPAQGVLGEGQAIAVLVFDTELAVAFQKDDPLLGVLGDADQGSGQFNFRLQSMSTGSAYQCGSAELVSDLTSDEQGGDFLHLTRTWQRNILPANKMRPHHASTCCRVKRLYK